jgi:hypothetical protein
MPEVKVQRDTKVTIQLSETEAGKLRSILTDAVNWEEEPWAEEIVGALNEEGVHTASYEASY